MEVVSIFLNRVLLACAKKQARSLHLSPGRVPLFKVDNKLEELKNEEEVDAELIDNVVKSFLLEDELGLLENKKEIIVTKDLAGELRFRINIFKQQDSYSISFYYLPSKIKTLSELKIPKIITNLQKREFGLLVVAGAFSSGKTTTCSALLADFNKKNSGKILTIEDPIENVFEEEKSLISQRQVGRDVSSSEDGIKYALNEDIDFAFIGEIKDNFDTAIPHIIDLASGNAFVLLELNASTSTQVIEKILNGLETKYNQEASRFALADVLLGVVVQKLLPKKNGGLALALEVLVNNSAVKSLVREGKFFQLDSVIQTSKKEGMISMQKSLEDLAGSGKIEENVEKFFVN